jgi:cell division septation protein DedD
MRGAFDDEEFEPVQRRRDAELTLGAGTLLAIFFGLVLLCGLFFGLGYAVGRHGAQPSSAAIQEPSAPTASTPAPNSRPKPSATPQSNPSALTHPSVDQPPSEASDTHPATVSQAAQPQVRPALPTAANPSPSAPVYRSELAAVPAGALMVQVAAVSHPEDADVLASALRRRGYAVTAGRDLTDGLIHVRIGPFSNRNDANHWRQKLLNDGYNAILQP